ncbi:MAG: hypothetical protein EA379_12450 [Phycisphaerales bacterium]|nr:MAG: hypothetical protein EA379_12450 [Phycisphaerales bacterium]
MSSKLYVRGGVVLTAGAVASSACSFARNIVIARLLGVEDYGIAAIFVIAVSLIERLSYLGLDRFIVQNVAGGEERVQAVAQAFQLVRGVVGAALLFALAQPIATMFGVPEVAPAFRWFALYPLIRGMAHLDLARFQREMKFKVLVLTDLAPQAVTLAIAAPIALWLGDYRVMLFVFIVQAACYVATSHALAERPFRLAWDTTILGQMLVFGWPLLLNGLLMFGILQGDLVIVGTALTTLELGYFSAAFTLMMAPAVILTKVLQSYFLPLLASVQNDSATYAKRHIMTTQTCLLAGASFAAGAMICGDDLLVLMYGEKYAPAAAVVPWLAAMQGVRIFRISQSVAAIGKGQTTIPMYANVARSVAIVLAIASVLLGYGLVGVAASSLLGELFAMLWSQRLLRRRLGLTTASFGPALITVVLLLAALGACLAIFDRQRPLLVMDFALGIAASGCIAVGLLWASNELRQAARRHTSRGGDDPPRLDEHAVAATLENA